MSVPTAQAQYPGSEYPGGYPGSLPTNQWVLDHYECQGLPVSNYNGTGLSFWDDVFGSALPFSQYTVGWTPAFDTGLFNSSVAGTVAPVFQWYGPDPAPDVLAATVSLSIHGFNGNASPDDVTAWDGFDDPLTLAEYSPEVFASLSGTHLVQKANPDHSTVVKLDPIRYSVN